MRLLLCLLYLTVAVGDGLVAYSVWTGHLQLGWAVVLRVTVVSAVGCLYVLLRSPLPAQRYLEWIVLTLGGPVGALCALWIVTRLTPQSRNASPELLEWYETLSGRGAAFEPSARAEHSFEYGTVLNPDAPTLKEIIEKGSLAAKRSAIAYLTSAYHRDYYEILRRALSDPEPTIRVQAAAVLTGLGQEARDDLDMLLTKVPEVGLDGVTALSGKITRHITSHLLDTEGMRQAVLAMAKLADMVIHDGDEGQRADMLVQLVWGCHVATGRDIVILRAMLNKLVATPLPEPAR